MKIGNTAPEIFCFPEILSAPSYSSALPKRLSDIKNKYVGVKGTGYGDGKACFSSYDLGCMNICPAVSSLIVFAL